MYELYIQKSNKFFYSHVLNTTSLPNMSQVHHKYLMQNTIVVTKHYSKKYTSVTSDIYSMLLDDNYILRDNWFSPFSRSRDAYLHGL